MFRRLWLAAGLALCCTTVSAKKPLLSSPVADDLLVEVVQGQQELGVDVPATAVAVGMQFGLVGALIGSGIQNAQVKSAESAIVPIRDQLIDYAFDARLMSALRTRLASEGLSPSPRIVVPETPWSVYVKGRDLAQMPPRALVIVPRYAIDSGFESLRVSLWVQLQDRTINGNNRTKVKSAFDRVYAWNVPLQGNDPTAQDWAGLGSQRLAALLDEAIEQTVDMITYDFSAEGRAQWDAKAQKTPKETTVVKGVSYAGRSVRSTEDWAWVRGKSNFMASVEGYRPITRGTPLPADANPALRVATTTPATALPAPDAGATPVTLPVPAPDAAVAIAEAAPGDVPATEAASPAVEAAPVTTPATP